MGRDKVQEGGDKSLAVMIDSHHVLGSMNLP